MSRTTENKWWDQWISYLLALVAFLIPAHKKLVPVTVILLAVVLIVRSISTRTIYTGKKDAPLYLLLGLFILHLIGITYSENVSYAWVEVGIKFSFLGFPLIALVMPVISNENRNRINVAFVIGCWVYTVVSIATGIYDAIQNKDMAYLSYALLSEPYHPTYAATYQAMAVFLLLYKSNWYSYQVVRRYLFLLLLIAMVVFISMLASKAGLLALWICLVVTAFYYLKQKLHLKYILGVPVLLLAISITSTRLLPVTASRIQSAVTSVQNGTTGHPDMEAENEVTHAQTSTHLRLVTWSSSWELMLRNPMGVGTGDTTNELVKIYERKAEELAAEKELNAHNQFLQTGAELGWLGLLLLIGSLSLLFVQSIRTKDLFLLTFLLVCGMNFLFESFLEVQAGIVFFCYWVLVSLRQD